MSGAGSRALRKWILGTLIVGLAGTAAELVLLEHYEDVWQTIPLMLVAMAAGVLTWHAASRNPTAVRALQATMALFLLSGIAGVALHFRGAAEFQIEIDPSMPRWEIVMKALHAKAPPVLAPGLMLQLGLLGLAYAYRHPDLGS